MPRRTAVSRSSDISVILPRMPAPFIFQQPPSRVIFGPGVAAQVGDEVARLGARRALVLATPEQRLDAERIAALLGDRSAGVYAGALMHVPMEVARAARAETVQRGADCCVAV